MKTLITATAITLATAATAMAGSYAGVEYNSAAAVQNGSTQAVTVGGPRIYTGFDIDSGDTKFYAEIGYYNYTAEADGYNGSASHENSDYEIGISHDVSDSTTMYFSYGHTGISDYSVGQAQVGVRFNF